MKNLFQQLNKPLIYLLGASLFLNIFLIVFSNLGILPLKYVSDFIFYTLICFALVIYRPKWGFLLFVSTIALENINIAPNNFGIMIRPYQFIGGLTIIAVLVKMLAKNSEYRLPKFNLNDALLLIFSLAGFASALTSEFPKNAFKQSVIIVSFVGLYFLVRIFLKNILALKEVALFFFSSGILISFYGVWQNMRFANNLKAFEIMAGRPNATFTEPDWLGMFCVFFLASLYSIMYYLKSRGLDKTENIILKITLLFTILTLNLTLLIITVARSAWVGAFLVSFIFLILVLTELRWQPAKWHWREAILDKIFILTALIVSLCLILFFHFTTFQLFNRVQSTGTGLQEITIACPGNMDIIIPTVVSNESEYTRYSCQHIRLEEEEQEIANGSIINKIYRPDPNINLRSTIYQKSIAQIKEYWFFGIGWSNINAILGKDERGAGLNSSNIFLEVWLGTGLLGFIAFIMMLLNFLICGVQNFIYNRNDRKYLGVFIILALVGIIIPNLFNAGAMLGVLWLFFGILSALPKTNLKQ